MLGNRLFALWLLGHYLKTDRNSIRAACQIQSGEARPPKYRPPEQHTGGGDILEQNHQLDIDDELLDEAASAVYMHMQMCTCRTKSKAKYPYTFDIFI